jgi:hypothetical protein
MYKVAKRNERPQNGDAGQIEATGRAHVKKQT